MFKKWTLVSVCLFLCLSKTFGFSRYLERVSYRDSSQKEHVVFIDSGFSGGSDSGLGYLDSALQLKLANDSEYAALDSINKFKVRYGRHLGLAIVSAKNETEVPLKQIKSFAIHDTVFQFDLIQASNEKELRQEYAVIWGGLFLGAAFTVWTVGMLGGPGCVSTAPNYPDNCRDPNENKIYLISGGVAALGLVSASYFLVFKFDEERLIKKEILRRAHTLFGTVKNSSYQAKDVDGYFPSN